MKNDWILSKLEIEYKGYGTKKGTYESTVKFRNSDYEHFNFKLTEKQQQAFLDIIRAEVIDSALELGNRLAESLKEGTDDAGA